MDEPPSLNLSDILLNQPLLYFGLTAVLVFFSAWASAVESAFFSLKAEEVDRFRNSDDPREKAIADLLIDPRLLLSVLTACKYGLLMASAVISVTGNVSGEMARLTDFSLWVAVLFITVIFALFGVILPKIYGTAYKIRLAGRNSTICKRLVLLFTPIVRPFLRMSVRIEKKIEAMKEQTSVEEFTQALQLSAINNEPVEGQREILEGIVNFGILRVKQVMRPKSEISYTDISLDFHQLLTFITKSGYSRIPVCHGSLDRIEGFLYIKDLLPFLEEGPEFSWHKLLRPGYFVNDSKKIDFLLKEFQEKRVHMAVVLSPQGATIGLITLEDIIEEIIGDINDEFDEIGLRYQKLDEKTFLFDGKTSLYEFCKALHIDPAIFRPIKGINESLGNIVLALNKKSPAAGDTIVIEPFTFVIEAVDQNRIKKIRVHIHETAKK